MEKLNELFVKDGWKVTRLKNYFPDAHTNVSHRNYDKFTGKSYVYSLDSVSVHVHILKCEEVTVDFINNQGDGSGYGENFSHSDLESIYKKTKKESGAIW